MHILQIIPKTKQSNNSKALNNFTTDNLWLYPFITLESGCLIQLPNRLDKLNAHSFLQISQLSLSLSINTNRTILTNHFAHPSRIILILSKEKAKINNLVVKVNPTIVYKLSIIWRESVLIELFKKIKKIVPNVSHIQTLILVSPPITQISVFLNTHKKKILY